MPSMQLWLATFLPMLWSDPNYLKNDMFFYYGLLRMRNTFWRNKLLHFQTCPTFKITNDWPQSTICTVPTLEKTKQTSNNSVDTKLPNVTRDDSLQWTIIARLCMCPKCARALLLFPRTKTIFCEMSRVNDKTVPCGEVQLYLLPLFLASFRVSSWHVSSQEPVCLSFPSDSPQGLFMPLFQLGHFTANNYELGNGLNVFICSQGLWITGFLKIFNIKLHSGYGCLKN